MLGIVLAFTLQLPGQTITSIINDEDLNYFEKVNQIENNG